MKTLWIVWILMLFCSAYAEDSVPVDMSPIYEFAEEYGFDDQIQNIYESAFGGDMSTLEILIHYLKEEVQEPMHTVMHRCVQMLPILFLSALISGMFPTVGGGSGAAQFLLRLNLLLGFSELAIVTLSSIEKCIEISNTLIGCVTPILTGILTAAGMEGSAALLSPMAAMAGNIAENIFSSYGIPLCKVALSTSIAGNLSPQISLKRITRFLMRVIHWGAGIVSAVFTAFLALQGNVSESLDGIAVRTAKFAADSAAPVIGNGISDAWESYLSGIGITKNAVGISGIAALFMASARPILLCLCAMICLYLFAALLDVFGEKQSAEAAEQIAGICQLALSLCTATMVIAIVLLAAVISMGKSLGG